MSDLPEFDFDSRISNIVEESQGLLKGLSNVLNNVTYKEVYSEDISALEGRAAELESQKAVVGKYIDIYEQTILPFDHVDIGVAQLSSIIEEADQFSDLIVHAEKLDEAIDKMKGRILSMKYNAKGEGGADSVASIILKQLYTTGVDYNKLQDLVDELNEFRTFCLTHLQYDPRALVRSMASDHLPQWIKGVKSAEDISISFRTEEEEVLDQVELEALLEAYINQHANLLEATIEDIFDSKSDISDHILKLVSLLSSDNMEAFALSVVILQTYWDLANLDEKQSLTRLFRLVSVYDHVAQLSRGIELPIEMATTIRSRTKQTIANLISFCDDFCTTLISRCSIQETEAPRGIVGKLKKLVTMRGFNSVRFIQEWHSFLLVLHDHRPLVPKRQYKTLVRKTITSVAEQLIELSVGEPFSSEFVEAFLPDVYSESGYSASHFLADLVVMQ
ncbi:hypothetical protein PCE1_004866 [Barthelona sp. PCE]